MAFQHSRLSSTRSSSSYSTALTEAAVKETTGSMAVVRTQTCLLLHKVFFLLVGVVVMSNILYFSRALLVQHHPSLVSAKDETAINEPTRMVVEESAPFDYDASSINTSHFHSIYEAEQTGSNGTSNGLEAQAGISTTTTTTTDTINTDGLPLTTNFLKNDIPGKPSSRQGRIISNTSSSSVYWKNRTKHHSSNTIILAFSDQHYKEIAWIWYQELNALGYTEHMVVAHDFETQAYFEQRGMRHDYIHRMDVQQQQANRHTEDDGGDNNATSATAANTTLIASPPKQIYYNFTNFRKDECSEYDARFGTDAKRKQVYKRSVFGSRWSYVLRKLEAGHNVLLTDVDNVFVRYKDLYELEQEPYDSMHAYAGTIQAFPRNIFAQTGFTLCGGMSWLRAVPGVVEIARALVERCGCESTLFCHCSCDDQVVFNSIILLKGPYQILWDQQKNITVPKTEAEVRWEELTGTCKMTGHRVKVWDRHVAYRANFQKNFCPDPKKSWIAMPSGLEKIKVHQIWKEACSID